MTFRSPRWFTVTVLPLLVLAISVSRSAAQVAAQQTNENRGTITGRVIDASTGLPLETVGIQVVGLEGVGASTNAAGFYTIPRIPAGTVTLQFRRIGYEAKTVTGILLGTGKAVTQDVALRLGIITLSNTIVTASSERGSVYEALNNQKTSLNVVSSVTSEQIAKSPDGDAAAATSRASSATIRDGKFVEVRGQGERAVVANYNNVRIPSPEPEKKQVPFDMFPAQLIRSIEVIKTATPEQPGDFSGALVNIQTRDFPAAKTVSYSSSVGFNSSAFSEKVLAAPTSGAEWLAFAKGERRMPQDVRAAGNFAGHQYTQAEINQLIGTFRNSWTPFQRGGMPNSSFGISAGGNDPFLGRQFGYIASLTYSMAQEVRRDESRALIDFNTGNSPANQFDGSTGRTSVLWGGILNLSTFVGDKSLITLNNMYNRTSDSEAHRDVGNDENLGVDNILERSTLSYVERSVRSNQLAGEHTLSSRSELDWSLTNSAVTRREPDRSDMVYISSLDAASGQRNPFELFTSSSDGARRTFADLTEGSWNAALNYTHQIGSPEKQNNIKFGGVARYTQRDAEVFQYSLATLRPLAPADARLRAEQIFDGRFTEGSESVFTINPLGQSGSYKASDLLLAGYAMSKYSLHENVQLVGGARVESSNVEVVTTSLYGFEDPVTRNFIDVLPSASLNFTLSEVQQLRLSASRTLARPEYRELSPILNRDVLGGQGFVGDTALVRSLINNYDLRWEWYPNPGELISVALFAKHYDRPIERVEVPTSGTSVLSYINAKAAENYGVEIELRKDLGNVVEFLSPFTVFGNLTLMKSEIRLGDTGLASATNPNRPLAGQAPYVVNAGLTYSSENGRLSATALYNRVGKRISAAGPSPLPDVYEMPRDVIDVSLRVPVLQMLDAKLDMKNLLDSPFEQRQGEVTRLRYSAGRVFSLGLSWKPRS